MKKKIVSLFFITGVSLMAAVPGFAANDFSSTNSLSVQAVGESTSVTAVSRGNYVMSSPINGAGQYGKITLTSKGESTLFVYINKGDGVWRQQNIGDSGVGHLFLEAKGGSDSLTFYMNKGWQYKIEVSSSVGNAYSATGYIKNYQ